MVLTMKAFVIAENEGAARELCAGARTLADSVILCVAGAPVITGVADKCIHVEVPACNIADDAYLTVKSVFDAEGADCILVENAIRPLSLAGRLCAAIGTAAIAGVTEVKGAEAATMFFGGTGTRVAKAQKIPAYIVGAGVFDAAAATGTDVVEEAAFEAPANAIVKEGEEPLEKSDVNLSGADVVVACGRGFAEKDELQMAFDLAAKVGGEVGCSRPLAEGMDWFPKEAYIGVTGQMLSPKVCFSLGVSGQMQHMIGVSGADVIVAVNKDKNAPVFKQCDLGFVGDLKDVLPALTAAL